MKHTCKIIGEKPIIHKRLSNYMDSGSLLKDLVTSLEPAPTLKLTGDWDLNLPSIISVALDKSKVTLNISKKYQERIRIIREKMLDQVRRGIPIYGTNTGFGARANVVLTEGAEKRRLAIARRLSKTIIHVDVSTGPPIEKPIVRAAMLLRINMLLPGHSAIRLETVDLLKELLNKNITPVVGKYGTVSASGDLPLNGRVLSVLLQLEGAKVWDQENNVKDAKSVLSFLKIKPLILEPKEGLALVNGDNFSTAIAAITGYDVARLFLLNIVIASITIQALRGNTRSFHPLLSSLRKHPGHEFIAQLFRDLLKGSKLAYTEMKGHGIRERGVSVQDSYSIRCLPQYFAPDWENLVKCWEAININANSVSDNPLWTSPEYTVKGEEPYQWVSGGNFFSSQMVDVLDTFRRILVRIVKQNDRHLARLVHPRFNNGLPPNLSDRKALSKCTFKGLQTQMGMYEVYASQFVNPISTAFGTHEEFNQDITSHAFTSGIMTQELLTITKYAVATNFISACQAIDLRGGPRLLSSKTRPFYKWLRQMVPYIVEERPLGDFLEKIADELLQKDFVRLVLKTLYS